MFHHTRRLVIVLALMLATRAAGAGWLPDGAPVALVPGNQTTPVMAPDGTGGAYVAWVDGRSGLLQAFIQRITPAGDPAPGWPLNGRLVAGSALAQTGVIVAPDGAGGALVSWGVQQANATVLQMLERIRPDGGLAPGWPAGGVICDSIPNGASPSYQYGGATQGMAPDGQGGAFVFYYSGTFSCLGYNCSGVGNDYALHVNGGGVPDWRAPGVRLGSTGQFYPNTYGILGADGIPDGGGGLFAFGYGYESGNQLLRISAAGTALWATSFGSTIGTLGVLAPDGAGGVYAVWDNPTAPIYTDSDSLFAQHWTPTGALAPGWPAQGVALGLVGTNGYLIGCAPDGAGGLLAEWRQALQGQTTSALLASRLEPDGTPAPGWLAGGTAVTTMPGGKPSAAMVADGAGGAFFAWTDSANDVFAVRRDGAGGVATGWSAAGTAVCTAAGAQLLTGATSPAAGVAFLAWQDGRNGVDTDVYAQKLPFDQAVPAEVSVAEAVAVREGARIEWMLAGPVTGAIQVERSGDGVAWTTLATVAEDGSGMVTYLDRTAAPGARLAYRLSLELAGRAAVAGETWITMPGARLAIETCAPNPARGRPTLTLSLPGPGRATLELLDAAGRRVAVQEVGDLGAGTHTLQLALPRVPPGGIYLVRLRQGGRAATARVLLLP